MEEDNASAEDESSSEERDVPLEREDPPERFDPPDPPQREPESQQDVEDITRSDPFQNMTEEEVAAWRTADDQFLGPG